VTRASLATRPGGLQQHLQPGQCRGRDRELREGPATDQAIRTACANQMAGAGQATAPTGQGPRP
jgi:hypothetical protein